MNYLRKLLLEKDICLLDFASILLLANIVLSVHSSFGNLVATLVALVVAVAAQNVIETATTHLGRKYHINK